MGKPSKDKGPILTDTKYNIAQNKLLQYITGVLDSVSELDTQRYMAAMANNAPAIPPALSDFIETTRREGFVAGWRACQAAMTEAITKLEDPAEGFEIADIMRIPSTSTTLPGDPKMGSTPWVVLQAIRKQHGMTGSEIVSVVQGETDHHAVVQLIAPAPDAKRQAGNGLTVRAGEAGDGPLADAFTQRRNDCDLSGFIENVHGGLPRHFAGKPGLNAGNMAGNPLYSASWSWPVAYPIGCDRVRSC